MDEKENWSRLPFIISLFAYEEYGEKSHLYRQPMSFHGLRGDDRWVYHDYNRWKETRLSFSLSEITEGRWIKIGRNQANRIITCLPDGSLTETDLFASQDKWTGIWKLTDGILELNVGGYSLALVGAQDGLHSGIETGQNTVTYFKVIHLL